LQGEKVQLLQMCEELEAQVKESHHSLEESLEKILSLEKELEQRDQEVEAIRTKLTEVAVIFERKEIKQRYSFEVLCEFIYDKAKRLYHKYETAVAQLKQANPSHDVNSSHISKKLELIEQEHDELKQVLYKNTVLANELTAKFQALLGNQPLSSIFERDDGVDKFRVIAGKVEVCFIQLTQENKHMKDRINDLIR
jgi:chromosome segregation ATPase